MIDVARIDHWAVHGTSAFHRASVPAKLLLLGCAVAAAVASRDPLPLGAGWALLVLAAAASGLPWAAIGGLSVTAAVFAALYGLTLGGGAAVYAAVVLKAVLPSYAAGILVATTPYPRIFAFLGRLLPEIVESGLFMTYRSFFILLDMMNHFGTAIRLRGGFSPGSIVRNGANIARGIGALLLRAVERSSRLYAVMTARGYSGSMAEPVRFALGRRDWLPLGLAVLLLLGAVLLRRQA
jgi:energy-coupling factor transporter transmembrane protein EcfT